MSVVVDGAHYKVLKHGQYIPPEGYYALWKEESNTVTFFVDGNVWYDGVHTVLQGDYRARDLGYGRYAVKEGLCEIRLMHIFKPE